MRRRAMLGVPLASLAAAAGLVPQPGSAAYPARPVRIVVPYPAGQASDLFARRFAEFLDRRVGQTFVVENRPGAGGNIGAAFVARSEPDGSVLLWGTNATQAVNEFLYANLGYDPVRDFEPVIGVVRLGMVLTMKRGPAQQSLATLLGEARSAAGGLAIGVPSTTSRAVLEMLGRSAGIAATPVPYNGSGQALTGLLRGDVRAVLDTVSASLGPIRDGQIAPVAVSLGQRAGSLPDIPTFREAGVELEVDAWNALLAPRGTSEETVRVLNNAVNAGLDDATLRAILVHDGAEPMGGTPAALAELMRRDRARWEPVIRRLGLTAQ